MSNTRLTVVVRKDLKLVEGLFASQVVHMADAFARRLIIENEREVILCPTAQEVGWCKEPYLSILAVHCYEDLVEIYEHVEREKLPCEKWSDTIPSPTFPDKAIHAFVGLAIGPADFDAIKMVTNGLDLY
jgi:peptidyl-tRNA hydrolase